MTHREILELRKLGDKLIDSIKQRRSKTHLVISILENTINILSNPIITYPVYPSPSEQNKGVIDQLLGNSNNLLQPNNENLLNDSIDLSTETLRVAARLGNFDWKSSNVWIEIKNHFNTSISHSDLKKLSLLLADDARIIPDRDAKRRKSVMIKWMEENWNKLSPFLKYYIFDGKTIKKTNE